MTVECERAIADDFLRTVGFTITTMPDGQRTLSRGQLRYDLEPACLHEACSPLPTNGDQQ